MSQYAPIAAPRYLWMLQKMNLLGKYHLILAHDVAANPEHYRFLFDSEDFIIMDNSLIELGEPVDVETMRKACNFIKPTCIVLPDHLENTQKTLAATMKAGEEWKAAGIDKLSTNGFMAVPQGKTYGTITDCYDVLREWAKRADIPLNYWGVPKVYGERNKTRMPVVEYIAGTSDAPPRNIHLLGFSHDLSDDIECAKHDSVMGIDSAVPLRLGMANVLLSMATKEHPPRGDYFEDSAVAESVAPAVENNIKYMRQSIQ